MSIQERFPKAIPAETQRIVSGILPGGSVCRLLGERGEQLVNEDALLNLDHREGRGGINPILLSVVSILQFLEDIPASFSSNHSQRRSDYRLRQQEQEMHEAGQDGYWLLAQVAQYGSSRLKALPEIALRERGGAGGDCRPLRDRSGGCSRGTGLLLRQPGRDGCTKLTATIRRRMTLGDDTA